MQKHSMSMTEIFKSLSVIDNPVSEEDRVVFLLASLPDIMLVTAFKANPEVPNMELVTERLLYEECKNERTGREH